MSDPLCVLLLCGFAAYLFGCAAWSTRDDDDDDPDEPKEAQHGWH